MANRGRLLIFAGIDNQVLVDWAFIKFLIHLCFIDNEVDVRLNFPNSVDVIIDCVYKPHFSSLSFGVISEFKVKELHYLFCFCGV